MQAKKTKQNKINKNKNKTKQNKQNKKATKIFLNKNVSVIFLV